MTMQRFSRRLLVAASIGFAALASVGCGGGSGAPKTADVKPADMPEGADWTGVYYSPTYGYLHVVQEGQQVNGKWLRPQKDRWGTVHGTATGDLLKFNWTEYTSGVVGPNSKREGKGYFKYKRPPGGNVDDQIVGEIGQGGDEVGDAWEAIKQRNMNPDLDSIGGTGATDLEGGDWDKENTEQSAPEEPAPPP